MKIITIFWLSLLSAVPLMSASAQIHDPKSDTLKWVYGKVENRVRSETVNQGGHFVSYGGKSFQWIQNGVDREYTFHTKAVEGNWNDAGKIGQLIYTVTCNGEEGTLRLIRTSRAIIVELDFLKPNKRTPHLYLLVNSIQKI